MKVKLEINLPQDNTWYSDKEQIKDLFDKAYEKNKNELKKANIIDIYYVASYVELFADSVATTQLSKINHLFIKKKKYINVHGDKKIIKAFREVMIARQDYEDIKKNISYFENEVS